MIHQYGHFSIELEFTLHDFSLVKRISNSHVKLHIEIGLIVNFLCWVESVCLEQSSLIWLALDSSSKVEKVEKFVLQFWWFYTLQFIKIAIKSYVILKKENSFKRLLLCNNWWKISLYIKLFCKDFFAETFDKLKKNFSNFSCRFLNPNIFFYFEF